MSRACWRPVAAGPWVGGLLIALIAACGGPERPSAAAAYVVRAGDTLYSISTRHGLDYHDVARWNGLDADYRISPGQVLRLSPAGAVTAAARPAPAAVVPALPVAAPPHWLWPADRAVGGSVPRPGGGVGIEINGVAGADVRAAAGGRVVYTGAGLRAYGQLVIIKHGEVWLTAYGYNERLLVTQGESVIAGQRIATMGLGPGNRPLLYFEIRENGRPVDPLEQLPPRN